MARLDHALEDDYEDVLRKAAHGHGEDAASLAERAGIDEEVVAAAFAGREGSPDVLRLLAPLVGLDAGRLVALARGSYVPQADLPDGVAEVSMDFHGLPVHAWLVEDPANPKDVIAIDTGIRPEPLLNALVHGGFNLKAIFITHMDPDHVGGVEGVLEKFPEAELWSPEGEGYAPGRHFQAGDVFAFGGLKLKMISSRGHGPAAVSIAVEGLDAPVVMVGDAIFAGSIGRPRHGLELALREIRENLLSLPSRTVLCPGHGALTTVGQELAHNPFFG
ncbi:MBL fold metallo-hydrolase [Sulfuriroseicoccus oceanibius]|uniref:MBL fold metallo-hydrolase n=1 Tax=Sulfuriroseicoccus oceanibius TaxID=2707525 RepID=A0A6B3LCH6_9BACT|nr:MBL fold metallo-hydrolase [Sulfuriroseicoccus oceanibius]QQL45989.1 MBL fold metallo-hydrolase [Sulfuriroseicoccus oceanibius]